MAAKSARVEINVLCDESIRLIITYLPLALTNSRMGVVVELIAADLDETRV